MKSILREGLRFYLARCPVTEGKGRLYRLLAERLLPAEREVIATLEPGFRMALDLTDEIQREIYFFGTYERKETALIRRLLRPGDVFWDVGASIGFYALTAAACVGRDGRVVAFEPFPPAWDRLQNNIRLNSFDQIHCVHAAVGAAPGDADLFFDRSVPDGVATLAPAPGQTSKVACRLMSIDPFLSETGERPPLVLKADVEGSEMAVVAGAAKLLSGPTPPMLLMEMEDEQFTRHHTSKAEIQTYLAGCGYAAYELKGRRWIRCGDVRTARCRNFLWIRPDVALHRERAKIAGCQEAP